MIRSWGLPIPKAVVHMDIIPWKAEDKLNSEQANPLKWSELEALTWDILSYDFY